MFCIKSHNLWASQVVLVIKNPPVSTGDIRAVGLIPGLGRAPGERYSYPLQYSGLENSMDKRSLAGYSLWDCKESNTNE